MGDLGGLADLISRHYKIKWPKILSHFLIFRLLQNRKSAKKCRLKKKAEFSTLADEVDALKKENKELHEKVSLLPKLTVARIRAGRILLTNLHFASKKQFN